MYFASHASRGMDILITDNALVLENSQWGAINANRFFPFLSDFRCVRSGRIWNPPSTTARRISSDPRPAAAAAPAVSCRPSHRLHLAVSAAAAADQGRAATRRNRVVTPAWSAARPSSRLPSSSGTLLLTPAFGLSSVTCAASPSASRPI